MGHRSSPIKVRCDALTDFPDKPFDITIAYVDPDIAGERVVVNNSDLFSWHWRGDDESILRIVTSVVDTMIVSIVDAPIPSKPDCRQSFREWWGCRAGPNGDGGLYARQVAPIANENISAGGVQAAMTISNQMRFCVLRRGRQADGTAGAQTPLYGGRSYLAQDNIIPPSEKDKINDIGEQSDDDGEMRRPNARNFLITKTGFQKFLQKLNKRSIRQQ